MTIDDTEGRTLEHSFTKKFVAYGVHSSQRTHGIPSRQDLRIAILEHLDELLGSKGLGDDNLEDVFGEPVVGHHKPALLPRPLAPRVLDLISDGLAGLGVNMYTANNHRVRHG